MRSFFSLLFLSLVYFLPAMPIDTSQIRLQYQQALARFEQKDYQRAQALAEKARQQLATPEAVYVELELGLRHILADCALEMGHYTTALTHYQQAKSFLETHQLTDGLPMAEARHKIGYYYQQVKDFEEAARHFEAALEIRRKILGNRHVKIADLYNNLGVCKNSMGDYDKALEFHDQALAIRLDLLPELHPHIAQSYNNLGICMENRGEFQLALRNYQKAMMHYRQLYGDHHLTLADVYLNIGPVYGVLGEPQRNIEYLMQALHIYQKQLDNDHPFLATCYNNLANAFAGQEDYQRAASMYERALAIRKAHYGVIHPDVAQTLFNKGICHFRQGESQEAKDQWIGCFQALNYEPKAEPVFEDVNDHYLLILLFYNLAELEKERFPPSQALEDLLSAFAYYQQADQLLDFLRSRYEAIGSKLELAELAHQIYDSAIILAIDLFELTEEHSYREEAFRFSEKSKGLLLLEALTKTEAGAFAGVPKERITEVSQLEIEIAELEKNRFLGWERISKENDHLIDSLNSEIFEKRQAFTRLINALRSDYPRYYDLRYETATMPVHLIQETLLAPGQSMVEYFLGDTYLHIFVINKNDFQVFRVEIREDFLVWLSTFRMAIRRFPDVSSQGLEENVQHYLRAAFILFQDLIAPVQGLLADQLIIIPDAELGLLPFDALLSEPVDDLFSFNNYPYLLRDYTISYNYSATLLREMKAHKNKKGLQSYLGLAPSFEGENVKGLSPLRFNQEEVIGARQMIGGHILAGVEATKANFITQQDDYKIIHLATHGKANNSSSDFSFLAFSESDTVQGEEALLYVKEIYNMATHAEMVVLSACETGIGKLEEGEGIASIARGFSYAGARSLVATQWSVDDKATNELIHLFFKNIKSGKPKGQALREAKLAFLESKGERQAHPYFWASFMPIGNMEPISFPWVIRPVYGLFPLAILFYLGYAWRKRKINKHPSSVKL